MGFRLPVLQTIDDSYFSKKATSSDLSINEKTGIEKAYFAKQVREMDRCAIEGVDHALPVPGIQLMKRAGKSLYKLLRNRWPERQSIYVFCGTGNNGGDGYIVAALAAQKQLNVRLIEIDEGRLKGDALLARKYAIEQGVEPLLADDWLADQNSLERLSSSEKNSSEKNALVVDALLGIGFSGQLRDIYLRLIQKINQLNMPVISADIASGLDADRGAVAEIAVKADVTVTFIAAKSGLLTGVGREYSGDIYLDKLGLNNPENCLLENESIDLLQIDELIKLLPQRSISGHKGSNGHLVLVGGDTQYGGAILMAAEAALRIGAGLVSVVTRAEHRSAILARQPEIMVVDAEKTEVVSQVLGKASVVVVGPGLGQQAWGQKLFQMVMPLDKPTLVDADALNIAAKMFALSSPCPDDYFQNSVFTPHPGEAARLLEKSIVDIQKDRVSAAIELQNRFGATVLLKGSGTIIAQEAGVNEGSAQHVDGAQLSICPYGNPGMSSAGMGDILSGVIGSLLAQGMENNEATKLGCVLHSKAADMTAEEQGVRGLLASDLIKYLHLLINR